MLKTLQNLEKPAEFIKPRRKTLVFKRRIQGRSLEAEWNGKKNRRFRFLSQNKNALV